MSRIEDKIRAKLSALESEAGFRILFACESGSRAWGFASADSDYDVRFVFAWTPDRYLAVSPYAETIDKGIDEDAIDLSGWELRKALGLFRKSNGALCEWLRSPIIYREEAPLMDEWRRLLDEEFAPKANAIHYLGLCRKMWFRIREEETVTAKRYLYALRALLSARFVIERGRPAPVPFEELRASLETPADVAVAVARMIAEKSGGAEADGIVRKTVVETYLESELERLNELADTLPDRLADGDRLDAFFRSAIGAT